MERKAAPRRLSILRNQLYSPLSEGNLAAYFTKEKIKDFLFRDLKSFRDEIIAYTNDSSLFKEVSVSENQGSCAYRVFQQFITLVKICGVNESMAAEQPERLLLLIEVANTINRSLGNIFLAHYSVYIRCLTLLGTEKHRANISKAFSLQDIGCVALGELGSGADLNKLETLAIYEPESAEFLLRSPSPLSLKFWVGNCAKLANKCVVFANLILEDHNYGPHAFLISIRQDQDHLPLPGIEIGEIGALCGSAGGDLGFIKFNDLRIPRDSLLDKYSSVTDGGSYVTDLEEENDRKATLEECFLEEKTHLINASLTLTFSYLLMAIKLFNKKTYFNSPFSVNKLILQTATPLIAYRFSGRILVDFWLDYLKASKRDFTMENLKFLIAIMTELGNSKCREAMFSFKKLVGPLASSQHSRLPNILLDSEHKRLFENDFEFDFKRMAKSMIEAIYASEARESALPFVKISSPNITSLYQEFGEVAITESTSLAVFKRLAELNFLTLIKKGRSHCEGLLQKSVSVEGAFEASYHLYYERACVAFANLFSFNQMSKLCEEPQNTVKLIEVLCKYWCLQMISGSHKDLISAGVLTSSKAESLTELELKLISWLNIDEISNLLDYMTPSEEILGSKTTPIRELLLSKTMNSIVTVKDCFEQVPWWKKIKNPFFS